MAAHLALSVHQRQAVGAFEQELSQRERRVFDSMEQLRTRFDEIGSRMSLLEARARRMAPGVAIAGAISALSRQIADAIQKAEPLLSGEEISKAVEAAMRLRDTACSAAEERLSLFDQSCDQLTEAFEAMQKKLAQQPASPKAPPTLRLVRPAGESASRIAMTLEVNGDDNLYADLSFAPSGVFVATHALLPPATPVELVCTMPWGETITTPARVHWLREYNSDTPQVFPGMGLWLESPGAATTAAMARYVATRSPWLYEE
jgi:hypothetical protein